MTINITFKVKGWAAAACKVIEGGGVGIQAAGQGDKEQHKNEAGQDEGSGLTFPGPQDFK